MPPRWSTKLIFIDFIHLVSLEQFREKLMGRDKPDSPTSANFRRQPLYISIGL